MNIDDKVRFIAPVGQIVKIATEQEKVDGTVVSRTMVTVQYESPESGKFTTKVYNADMLEIVS